MITSFPEIAQLLISRGGNPNTQDCVGRTPLHNTVDKGIPETIQILLQGGADCTIQDKWGESPVHLAARKGYKMVSKFILLLISEAQ